MHKAVTYHRKLLRKRPTTPRREPPVTAECLVTYTENVCFET